MILHGFRDKGEYAERVHHNHVAAWGIAFPPQNNGSDEPATVQYMVTVRELENIQAASGEEDGDD